MKTYTTSAADSWDYKHANPERTAYKNSTGFLNFDVVFKVWPNRASLAKTIRMQEKREFRRDDWKAVVPLGQSEGY
jgi:hypothetical protein